MGVPIDVRTLETLRTAWNGIQDRLIQRIDRDYGVYDGRTFKTDRFAAWLVRNDIAWPRLDSGLLALDDDTSREMARSHPAVAPIRELRVSLSRMRLADLAVGSDGRNRCLLSAFRARTSRNQPSNAKFIFGPAVWLRSLIQPEPGFGLAYVDWSQQEFGIGAALSGDTAMIGAYESGDPYLAFAKQARAVPPDGTKETHGGVRDLYKTCALGLQYGMGDKALAQRIGQSTAQARELIRQHHQTFSTFWTWLQAAVDQAMLHGQLKTTFGWTIHVGPNANPRSLSNFPLQGNGAEMLRLACIIATERGARVCAPVHDAILIEAPLDQLDDAVRETQRAMGDASELVLDGFRLRSDVKLIRHPDRFVDKRGQRMWSVVQDILAEFSADGRGSVGAPLGAHKRDGSGASTLPPYSLISPIVESSNKVLLRISYWRIAPVMPV